MSDRKIIIDITSREPVPIVVCPSCGAPLSSMDRSTLRTIVHQIFRCPPGRHPRAFEGRCGGCGRVLILWKSEHGLALVPGDQANLLKWIRDADRETTDSYDRDRDEE